ncbi:MAG: hypothetical protein EBX54_00355 [Betaproteobacteria bacterium]|nr:hypothetical protein [Betaproteobacteria bacterium]
MSIHIRRKLTSILFVELLLLGRIVFGGYEWSGLLSLGFWCHGFFDLVLRASGLVVVIQIAFNANQIATFNHVLHDRLGFRSAHSRRNRLLLANSLCRLLHSRLKRLISTNNWAGSWSGLPNILQYIVDGYWIVTSLLHCRLNLSILLCGVGFLGKLLPFKYLLGSDNLALARSNRI